MKTNITTAPASATTTTTPADAFATLQAEAVSSPPPAKAKARPRKLLVDNLKHVHDHGLAVEFTDESLTKWLEEIRAHKNGKLLFCAGESKLHITRNGDVTRTHFVPGRGYSNDRIHYHCPATKIKATILSGHAGFDYLDYLLFGSSADAHISTRLPLPWMVKNPMTGASQDLFRTHTYKMGGWWLLGESGLRAFAAHESLVKPAKVRLDAAQVQATHAKSELQRFEKRDWNAELKDFSRCIKENTARLASRVKELEEAKLAKAPPAYGPLSPALRNLGVSALFAPPYGRVVRYRFPSTPEGWSHPGVDFNYKVTLSSDGGSFLLSSGIKCPVSVEAALEWLRGKAPAPMTIYGEVKVVDARDAENNPVRVVACGCHRLDLRPLGEEFAKLLTPKHKVVRIDGKPELVMNGTAKERRAFYSELRRRVTSAIRAEQDRHDVARRDLINSRASFRKTMTNREAVLAELKAKCEDATAAAATAEKAFASILDGVTGATLDQCNKMGVAICNVLLPKAAESNA